MTNRICALTVVLSDNIREDDAGHIMAAIGMVKGVMGVTPVVADPAMYCARAQARLELEMRVLDVLGEVIE